MENMPQPVDGMMEGLHVVKISGGHSHAAAVTYKGELFWWGVWIWILLLQLLQVVVFMGRSEIMIYIKPFAVYSLAVLKCIFK